VTPELIVMREVSDADPRSGHNRSCASQRQAHRAWVRARRVPALLPRYRVAASYDVSCLRHAAVPLTVAPW